MNRLPRLAITILLGTVGALACTPRHPEPETLPRLPTLRESHVIGCTACEGREALSAVDLGLMDDGTVVVLDEFEPFVRVFDPSGELVRTLGREGEGPGELQLPGWLLLNEDRSLRVLDAGPMQLEGYGPDGRLLETIPFPASGFVPTGRTYDASRRRLYMTGNRWRRGERPLPTVARLSLDDPELVTLWTGPQLPGVGEAYSVHEDGHPFDFAVAVGPDGEVAVGNGYRYRIAMHDADGERIRELGRDLPRHAKPEEHREYDRRITRNRPWEPTPDYPHFQGTGLELDDRGRQWVWRVHAREAPTVFDVLDPEEGCLGTLELDVELSHRTLESGSAAWRHPVLPAFKVAGGRLAAIVFADTGNTVVKVWELQENERSVRDVAGSVPSPE